MGDGGWMMTEAARFGAVEVIIPTSGKPHDDVAERARARAERLASMPPEWHAEVTRKLYGRERNR